jgi:AcrR family transcriptional regulator
MTTEPTVRVRAQQRRSQATFEAILAAAGSRFDEVGVEATTMDAISRHAGVSIGTVYRFFENRDAIVATLQARWRERIQEAALPVFGEVSLQRGAAAVITDFLAGFRRALDELPGARGLLGAVTTEATPQEAVLWTAALDRFIQRYAPGLRPARRRQAAQTYQTITTALMITAAGAGQHITSQLEETRSVLLGYTTQLATEARNDLRKRKAGSR